MAYKPASPLRRRGPGLLRWLVMALACVLAVMMLGLAQMYTTARGATEAPPTLRRALGGTEARTVDVGGNIEQEQAALRLWQLRQRDQRAASAASAKVLPAAQRESQRVPCTENGGAMVGGLEGKSVVDFLARHAPPRTRPDIVTCSAVNTSLSLVSMASNGRRCIFPYVAASRWIGTCAEGGGVCATSVDSLGSAVETAPCLLNEHIFPATPESVACQSVMGVASIPSRAADPAGSTDGSDDDDDSNARQVKEQPEVDHSQPVRLPCDTILGKKARAGVCRCTNGLERIIGTTDMWTTCEAWCSGLHKDVRSSAHSVLQQGARVGILEKVAELAIKHTPPKGKARREIGVITVEEGYASLPIPELGEWKTFMKAVDAAVEVEDKQWCGRGIALMAGSVSTLPQALAMVAFIRGALAATIPVEVWRAPDEEYDFEYDFLAAVAQLGVIFRTLPKVVVPENNEEMFALKPAVVLASSFDEVLLLDADALPLTNPDQLFAIRKPDSSAVFWPDYWTLLHDARIWETVGGWPHGKALHAAAQDSGLMVVCKTCGAWRPLALAFYFNYHNDLYYPAIYNGHFDEKRCNNGECQSGHDTPGAGDKDTFQIAYYALRSTSRFQMMRPGAIGGTVLPKRRLVCGSSFIHRDPEGHYVALHHNSNKWWWRDFHEGRWAEWKSGLLLSHLSVFQDESEAYYADGMNDWRSITYSNRVDAGKQNPPPGARWCIIYKGKVEVRRINGALGGFELEKTLLRYHTKLYSAPWMVKWASLLTGRGALEQCLRGTLWEDEAWLQQASDEDMRNTLIAHLSSETSESTGALQSMSDFRLAQACKKYLQREQKKKK